MLGTLGTQELIVIFLLALVLFGPKDLPKLGRSLGKALTEFRRASNELKATFDREMQNLEAETKPLLQEPSNPYQYDNYNYDYSSYETGQEGAYGPEIHDVTVASTSTPSASAPQGAESASAVVPGAVAHESETVAVHEANGHAQDAPAASQHSNPTAEHRA